MKKPILLALMLSVAPIATLPSFAKPHTPARNSSERKAIMSALHGVLGKGKHQPLIFARAFHVERGWAFVTGGFKYADGAPLEAEFQEGSGTNFSALLHYENKRWRVKRRLYHGDVVIDEFKRDFPQAPRAIFQDE